MNVYEEIINSSKIIYDKDDMSFIKYEDARKAIKVVQAYCTELEEKNKALRTSLIKLGEKS